MEVRRIFVPLLALAVCCVVCQSQSTYRFTENNYDGYEGSQRVRVHIERIGDTSQSGSVRITTFASTANAGTDYTSLNLVVDFTPGEDRKTVDVDLIDDNIVDEGETFTVRLSEPTRGEVGSPSQAVVAINDGEAPSPGIEQEVLIAIIVACVAAVLILLICCLLIYCLRFRNVKEDVVYLSKPVPEPEPERFIPPQHHRPYTPPLQRPYTPPPEPSIGRPRTPPPVTVGNPNTQVMVINEPSPPIIEPPPPKPTQVIVIRPQTPEIVRRRPEPTGPTEVIVSRQRPRSASPRFIVDEPDEPPLDFEDRPPSPVIVRRVIRKPVPIRDGDRFRGHDYDRFGLLDRDYRLRNFDSDRFGGRDALLNFPPGLGPRPIDSHLPLSAFDPPLPPPSFGPPSFGPLGAGSAFGPTLPPSGFGPPGFGSAFGPTLPPSGFGPPGFGSAFGPTLPPSGFGRPRPPVSGPPPGYFGSGF